MKKNILMLIIGIVLIVVFSEGVLAQPSIISISDDTIIDGQEDVVVNGTGFGTKSTSNPLIFDNFDSNDTGRQEGNTIFGKDCSHYGQWMSDTWDSIPHYSSENQRKTLSSLSSYVRMTDTRETNHGALFVEFSQTNAPVLLIDFWTSLSASGGSWGIGGAWQIKYWRMIDGSGLVGDGHTSSLAQGWWSNRNPNGDGFYNMMCCPNPIWPNYYETCKPVCSGVNAGFDMPIDGGWIHQTIFLKQSTNSTTNDGRVLIYVNNTKFEEDMPTYNPSLPWRRIIFGYYLGTEGDPATDQVVDIYFDDIYIDDTWQSVYIGDNSNWASCTHREIQIPTVWSDGSITFTVNQGSFGGGETAYLFVVDENGNMGSGYPITFGSAINDTLPPIRSSPSPTGNLSSGTTQTTISLDTDESATCKYSTTAGVSYPSMTNTFSTTGGTTHSTLVTGLQDGNTYNYYIRCNDTSSNYNTDDFLISFGVSQASTSCGPADNNPLDGVVDIGELMNYIGDWKLGSVTIEQLMTAIGEWKNGC